MPQIDFFGKVGETAEWDFGLEGKNKQPQDLTAATSVTVKVRAQDALGAGTGAIAINDASCTFVADTSGTASYVSPAVIAFPAGYYFVDVTARFPGGITRKFPEKGFALLLVSPA